MRARKGWAVVAAVMMTTGLVACGSETEVPAIQDRIALEAFNDCVELETYIEDVAVDQMNAQLDGISRNDFGNPRVLAGEAPANDAAQSSSAPTAYTKTNTQVEGVDEADFVKTDGTRIFVLSGQKLYATKSWPPGEMSVTDRLRIEGYPTEMFLDEAGRIVVFSYVYPDQPNGGSPYVCDWGCGWWGSPFTKMTIVEASPIGQLDAVSEVLLAGTYANSRRIGNSVRVVTRDHLRMPEGVRWYPEFHGDWEKDRDALKAAVEAQKVENERLIRAQSLDRWLASGRRVLEDGTVEPIEPSCTDFHRANAPVQLGVATVATLDLTTLGIQQTSVLGQVGEIYASQAALYIATPHWWWWPQVGQRTYTYFHKFDISNPTRATYVASGGAEGYLLDQFSMDEHDGFLRVATTIARSVEDDDNPWGRWVTTNRVSVLGERAGHLVVHGQTKDIAKDETIRSARFIGDKGFVVTFRNIDPLFTIDMSDPTNPRVIGELKVPGFSSYIHPLDANHLLTVGVHLPEPRNDRVDWSQRRMKLTVFDVSNFSKPRELHTALIGTAYGWSEAVWEHKAFNWFPERKMLALPFSDWDPANSDYWRSFVSELRLFHVDVDSGITPRGAISMTDLYRDFDEYGWSYAWSPWIRRSVMADDFAYAISDAGIRVANMENPSTPVATVLFDGVEVER